MSKKIHKKSLLIVVLLIVAIVCICLFLGLYLLPAPEPPKVNDPGIDDTVLESSISSDPYWIIIPGADTFGENEGLFIYNEPTKETSASNEYHGSIAKELNDAESFHPTYSMVKKQDDVWLPFNVANDPNAELYITVAKDQCSVNWNLKENAPAGIYGVRCDYDQDGQKVTDTFQIIYANDWTYISLREKNSGNNYINNFFGGDKRTLELKVGYNNGATLLSVLLDEGTELTNGAIVGQINSDTIITPENLQFTMTTVSGKVYPLDKIYVYDDYTGNIAKLLFEQNLASGEQYILKISSKLVDGLVYGQFLIDNSAAKGGVNLSGAWGFFVILGSLLILIGVAIFIVPLIMLKVNENKVYKENVRIARMKNPDAYADEGNFWQKMKNKLQKFKERLKSPLKKQEAPKPKLEDYASDRPKFTDIIKENRQKREYMQEHGISSEKLEEMQKAEAARQEAAKHSFASLRDDDDEIASLQEDKEEVSTIETGSYVQDGVTFSKLDSLKDEDDNPDKGW